jgi:hypothetical protein
VLIDVHAGTLKQLAFAHESPAASGGPPPLLPYCPPEMSLIDKSACRQVTQGTALGLTVDLIHNQLTLHAPLGQQYTVTAVLLGAARSWLPMAVLRLPGDMVSLTAIRAHPSPDAPPPPRGFHFHYESASPATGAVTSTGAVTGTGAVTSTGASRAGLGGGAATSGAPMALLPAYVGINGQPAGLLDFMDRERSIIHERVMDRERRRGSLLQHRMLMEDIDEEMAVLDAMMEHRLGHSRPLHVTIGGAGDEGDEGGHHLHGRARGTSAVAGVSPACIADVDMADACVSPAGSHMDALLSPQPSRIPPEIQPEIANL